MQVHVAERGASGQGVFNSRGPEGFFFFFFGGGLDSGCEGQGVFSGGGGGGGEAGGSFWGQPRLNRLPRSSARHPGGANADFPALGHKQPPCVFAERGLVDAGWRGRRSGVSDLLKSMEAMPNPISRMDLCPTTPLAALRAIALDARWCSRHRGSTATCASFFTLFRCRGLANSNRSPRCYLPPSGSHRFCTIQRNQPAFTTEMMMAGRRVTPEKARPKPLHQA